MSIRITIWQAAPTAIGPRTSCIAETEVTAISVCDAALGPRQTLASAVAVNARVSISLIVLTGQRITHALSGMVSV